MTLVILCQMRLKFFLGADLNITNALFREGGVIMRTFLSADLHLILYLYDFNYRHKNKKPKQINYLGLI